jgi:hypothetical protein
MKITLPLLILLAFLLAGCAGQATTAAPAVPAIDATQVFHNALLTATYAMLPQASATPFNVGPSNTPVPPSAVPTKTPVPVTPTPRKLGPAPKLPDAFTSPLLDPWAGTPHTYLDTCQYLKMKWDPNNSAPGTLVMPIMFHSITDDSLPLAQNYDIHHSDLVILLKHAADLGFKTVTTQQLVNFLYHNAKIPTKSMILIVDDRRPGAFKLAFGPFLEKYHWTLTLAWDVADTDTKAASNVQDETFTSLWQQMEAYAATGFIDMQSHGYVHNIPIDDNSSDAFIDHEMVDSHTVLNQHFYCKDLKTGQAIPNCKSTQPLAYIWPGGGYSKRAAEIGRTAGYQIAFSDFPRGPIMFNWIPLLDTADPRYPALAPEGPVGDPLMTLPRYWPQDAAEKMDNLLDINRQAAAYAAQNKDTELTYYDIKCADKLGPIPTAKPK